MKLIIADILKSEKDEAKARRRAAREAAEQGTAEPEEPQEEVEPKKHREHKGRERKTEAGEEGGDRVHRHHHRHRKEAEEEPAEGEAAEEGEGEEEGAAEAEEAAGEAEVQEEEDVSEKKRKHRREKSRRRRDEEGTGTGDASIANTPTPAAEEKEKEPETRESEGLQRLRRASEQNQRARIRLECQELFGYTPGVEQRLTPPEPSDAPEDDSIPTPDVYLNPDQLPDQTAQIPDHPSMVLFDSLISPEGTPAPAAASSETPAPKSQPLSTRALVEIRNDLLPSRKQEMTQLSIIIALERCIIRQLRATDAPMIETLADLDVQSAGSLQNASTFAKQCCVYLSLLYQMDIIEEALILAWHRNPIISLRYGLSKTEVIAIRKAVLPFVNYLLSPPAAPQEAAPADEAEEPELQVAATDDL